MSTVARGAHDEVIHAVEQVELLFWSKLDRRVEHAQGLLPPPLILQATTHLAMTFRMTSSSLALGFWSMKSEER
jgi:hypothetical protein